MKISVIIPTLNEAENIGKLIKHLKLNAEGMRLEIIVVDGESTDKTVEIAQTFGATVFIAPKSRAKQMNFGAKNAQGEVLYFVHADCLPPKTYIADIQDAISNGYPIGCFRYKFDSNSFLLKLNAYFNRFSPLWCRGGDETLFVTKEVFNQLGSFDENFCIMEEYALIQKAYKNFRFKIIPKSALVSARKYATNSWIRVQYANFIAFSMFKKNVSPSEIAARYKEILTYR